MKKNGARSAGAVGVDEELERGHAVDRRGRGQAQRRRAEAGAQTPGSADGLGAISMIF